MKFTYFTLILFTLTMLGGCDMFDYHPYDVKVSGETDINNHNIARIEESTAEHDTIRFIAMGDSQGFYDETRDFTNHVNSLSDIDFVIHLGDFTDYGTNDEFVWQRDIMNRLNIPYIALIGNHDCLGTGNDSFHAIFGDYNFSFIAGDTKFICLNTNALEYDYSEPIPDFDFLLSEMNDSTSNYSRTIVAMHARPYSDVFNNNVAQMFNYCVSNMKGMLFCLNGHNHKREDVDIFGNGIIYHQTADMSKRSYIIFTITPDNYYYETIYF